MDIEQIDPFSLGKHSSKAICGIYFLFFDDKLIYIGQSRNIHVRVSYHINRSNINFNAFSFVEIERKLLNQAERHFVRKFQPPANKYFFIGQKEIEKRRKKSRKIKENRLYYPSGWKVPLRLHEAKNKQPS